MKPGTSTLLDAIRVLSALGVFVSHCFLPWFSSFGHGSRLYLWAHACVITFFVLSGYVIAFTTLARRRHWREYCAARLARIYSVVVPAIAVTALLCLVGRQLAPGHYAQFDRGYEAVRLALTTLFLNETWFLSSAPPTNLPFWSMAYEFWYYVLFGVALFARAGVMRWLALLAVAMVCGPKVLLLFPVWLAGVAAYLAGQRWPWPRRQAVLGLVPLGLAVLLLARAPVALESFGHPPLFYSGLYLTDWGWGAALAFAIFLADRALGDCAAPRWLAMWIKAGAGVTFSLYLFHMPLLIFVSGVVPYSKTSPLQVAAAGGAVLLATALLGLLCERRSVLKALATRVERALTGVAANPVGVTQR
jgi:peptidoglycan/LPS O-acetylase OafA/YrhL